MAIYRITVVLKGKTVRGIRELVNEDVDTAWQIFYASAVDVYSAAKILDFEVVKVSSYSDEYREWKAMQEKERRQAKQKPNRKDNYMKKNTTIGERAKLNKPPDEKID